MSWVKWLRWHSRPNEPCQRVENDPPDQWDTSSLTTETLDAFLATRSSLPDDDDETALPVGYCAGVWRVVGPLGEGGMGAVYVVERDDQQFSQRAALKLVKSVDSGLRARFKIERDRLARLEHPGISRIIDGGETETGQPYMVVEFIDGWPITKYAQREQLNVHQRIALVSELTDAVRYAHQNLILHRDIKPANVLVDKTGNVKLIDFGVATLIGEEQNEASSALTIAYAAPESLSQTTPTVSLDIFSIGVLIYELVTGHVPKRNSEGGVLLDRASPLDKDLQAIISQATATEPQNRYRSIDSLAEDLNAHLDGRAILARKGGLLYQLTKGFNRYPVASSLGGLFVTSILGGLIVTSGLADKANREADKARAEQARAEYALHQAELNFRVQEAYGDILHRMFGGMGNTERMTDAMERRWQEAQRNAATDPDHAAEITYAIGRNFIERNDYQEAISILTPWIDQGYGDPTLLIRGKLYLGLAHRYQGSYDKAEPLLRTAISHYANSRDHGGFFHILGLITLSGITGEKADINEAANLAQAALLTDETVENKIFYLNVLGMVSADQRNFDQATDYNRQIIALLDANPLLEIAGQDVVRTNDAMTEAYHAHDYSAALEQLDKAEQLIIREKGESQNLAYIYDIRGVISAISGDIEEAILYHQRAIKYALNFGGEGSDIHGYTGASYIETLVASGRLTEAASLTTVIENALAEHFDGLHTRFTLAKAALIQAQQGNTAASAWLEKVGMDRDHATRNVNAKFRYDRLIAQGVQFKD